jgi:thioesterase domain-containing protein
MEWLGGSPIEPNQFEGDDRTPSSFHEERFRHDGSKSLFHFSPTFSNDEDSRRQMDTLNCVIEETALRQVEEYLHQQIPITRALGVRVVENDENGFAVEAPVALNSNHLRTAFGGSINAVATLAAYGFIWLELNDPAVHVVIAESAIRFLRPVRTMIHAVCQRPEANEWKAFRTKFGSAGKARIILRVNVVEAGQTAAEFEGTFVARSK